MTLFIEGGQKPQENQLYLEKGVPVYLTRQWGEKSERWYLVYPGLDGGDITIPDISSESSAHDHVLVPISSSDFLKINSGFRNFVERHTLLEEQRERRFPYRDIGRDRTLEGYSQDIEESNGAGLVPCAQSSPLETRTGREHIEDDSNLPLTC